MLEYIKRFAEGWDAPSRRDANAARGTRTRARERVREERSIVYTHPIVRLETRERLETRD
jgi:hypothetical protein